MKRELFKSIFLGEEVEVLIDMSRKSVQETKEGTLIDESPLATTGFVLDLDDEYCYLGRTPDEITKGIRFEYIIGVEIIKPKNMFDQALDDLPTEGQGN